MLQTNLTIMQEKIHSLLSKCFPEVTQQGLVYYSTGKVISMQKKPDGSIAAFVKDTDVWQVQILLKTLSFSTCSCLEIGICKHIAAVMHALLENNVILNEVETESEKKAKAQAKANVMAQAKSISTLLPSLLHKQSLNMAVPKRITKPQQTGTVEQWYTYFANKFSRFDFIASMGLSNFYDEVVLHLLPFADTWNLECKQVYSLHVHLYVIMQTEQIYWDSCQGKTTRNYYDYSYLCTRTNNRSYEQIVKIVRSADRNKLQVNQTVLLEQTMEILPEIIFRGIPQTPIDWLKIYRYLWWNLLFNEQWVIKEHVRLERQLAEQSNNPVIHELTYQALIQFDVMLGRDEKAMRSIEQLTRAREHELIAACLQFLMIQEQWERLLHWLRWMIPAQDQYSTNQMLLHSAYWIQVAKHLPVEEEWMQTMISQLPRSFHSYAAYLIGRGHYRLWVDIQIFMRVFPKECDKSQIKIVEIEAPTLLLVWYHQAVEWKVAGKHRESYKEAVYILKKLKQQYKRMKQVERWHQYKEKLAQIYARQRAFLDEMELGGLNS